MAVPFLNLRPLYERIQPEVEPKILEILSSGQYVMGPHLQSCEKALANYVKAPHAFAVSNGTIALQIALMAAGVGVGDEVIVPGFSFFATAEMVSVLGAKPVFVDIEPDTYNIDVEKVEKKITDKTKAIMPVSLYGQMADMTELMSLADQHNLVVIEDAAQSFGATYKGSKSCSVAHMSCTSFFPAKPLGAAGDGGAVFTNHAEYAEKIEAIRVHGQTGRYHHEYIGVNGRLDPLQCVVIEEKLKHYDKDVVERQNIAKQYSEAFSKLKGVKIPAIREDRESVFAQYTLKVPARDEFVKRLGERGVPSSVHYPKGMHQQPAYQGLDVSLPNTEEAGDHVFSLPLYPFMPSEDILTVINEVIATSEA